MLGNMVAVRRPRGRPQVRSDEETRLLLIEAAAIEFELNGYAQASIDAVAQRAGVSTKTLYRLIPTKADLFTTVATERINQFMLAIEENVLKTLEPVEALHRILFAYGKLTLAPQTISLNRLVIGEAERFPEIATAFYKQAIVRITDRIAGWLLRETKRDRLNVVDPVAAAGMLRGMMILEPMRATMLGQRDAPTLEEIDARALACAVLFFEGIRPSTSKTKVDRRLSSKSKQRVCPS